MYVVRLTNFGKKSRCIVTVIHSSTWMFLVWQWMFGLINGYYSLFLKNAKSSLGETIYRHMIGESFCAEAMLHTLDLSTEHNAVEIANRIEAAIHVWRCRRPFRKSGKYTKHTDLTGKHSWVIMKDNNGMDTKRREILARRAESLLLCLKQKFPGLRQSLLDMTKIQFNRVCFHLFLSWFIGSNFLSSRIDFILTFHDSFVSCYVFVVHWFYSLFSY